MQTRSETEDVQPRGARDAHLVTLSPCHLVTSAVTGAGWLALALLLAPLAVALWVSFSPDELLRPPVGEWSLRWYRQFLREPRWQDALVNSLVVGGGSVLVALAGGVPLAVAVVRHSFRGRGLLAGLVLVPLCVPPLVLGM